MTDAPDFRRTIDEMKRQLVSQSISDFGETASVSLANEKPGYAGTHTCKNCHQIQYEYWSKHSHAKAMDTLRRTNNQTDATCIGCHSLGYGQPDGYYGTVVPKFFENVQCETCHGMAGIHLDDVLTHKPSKTVPKSTCMACHGAFHEEKPFNYDKMLPLASCPSAKPLEPDPPSPDMEGDTGEILGPKNLKRPE